MSSATKLCPRCLDEGVEKRITSRSTHCRHHRHQQPRPRSSAIRRGELKPWNELQARVLARLENDQLSLRQLGIRLDCSDTTVTTWFERREQRYLTKALLGRVAQFVGVSVDDAIELQGGKTGDDRRRERTNPDASEARLRKAMFKRYGPRWRTVVARKAKPGRRGSHGPLPSQAMKNVWSRRTPLYRSTLGKLTHRLTAEQLLIIEDDVRHEPATAQLVRETIDRFPGRRPDYKLDEIRRLHAAGRDAMQIAKTINRTVQWARHLIALVQERDAAAPRRCERVGCDVVLERGQDHYCSRACLGMVKRKEPDAANPLQRVLLDRWRASDLTQREFAKRIGVSHSALQTWISGAKKPAPATLRRLGLPTP